MAKAVLCAETFLFEVLMASANGVPVCRRPIPPEHHGKIVIGFQLMAERDDTQTDGGERVLTELVYDVTAEGPVDNPGATLGGVKFPDVVKIIDVALQRSGGDNEFGTVSNTLRERPSSLSYRDPDTKREVTRLGGFYRLFVAEAEDP